MQWAQVIVIIGSVVSVVGVLYWKIAKLERDVKSSCEKIDAMGRRIDGHANRLDQLYYMFMDLIKEARK